MKFKMTAFCLVLTILTASIHPVMAAQNQQSTDWNALKNYLNEEVAIKTRNQKTLFGVLRNTTDSDLKMQVVTKNYNNEILLKRDDIEKIWRAKLRFGRNTVKGAGIGAAGGAGSGLAFVLANRKSGDGQVGAAVPVLAIYGAGIGALVGFFVRKKHKKEKLIYQN